MKTELVKQKIRDLVAQTQEVNDIQTRVVNQEKISGYLIFLQSEEEKAFADFKSAYMNRRVAEARYVFDSENSVSRAKESAPFKCRNFRENETKSEIKYEGIKLFRQAIQTHLESMRQATSHYKYEVKIANQS